MSQPTAGNGSVERAHLIRTVAQRLADEFVGTFGPETVERFVADSLDRLLATARITTFLPVLAERFARERLRALAKTRRGGEGRLAVLFLCVHNAGRSQMAAGWMRHLGAGRLDVYTGGSQPSSQVNPVVVEAMAEVGIDISAEFPKPWTDEVVRAADVVVTMGCGDACPLYPGTRYEDWDVPDPEGLDLAAARVVRDQIRARAEALLAQLTGHPAD